MTKFQNDVFLRAFDLCQRLLVQKKSIFYENGIKISEYILKDGDVVSELNG